MPNSHIAYRPTSPRRAWVYRVTLHGETVDTAWTLAGAEKKVTKRMRELAPEQRDGLVVWARPE